MPMDSTFELTAPTVISFRGEAIPRFCPSLSRGGLARVQAVR
jgi:hypothetical protein